MKRVKLNPYYIIVDPSSDLSLKQVEKLAMKIADSLKGVICTSLRNREDDSPFIYDVDLKNKKLTQKSRK